MCLWVSESTVLSCIGLALFLWRYCALWFQLCYTQVRTVCCDFSIAFTFISKQEKTWMSGRTGWGSLSYIFFAWIQRQSDISMYLYRAATCHPLGGSLRQLSCCWQPIVILRQLSQQTVSVNFLHDSIMPVAKLQHQNLWVKQIQDRATYLLISWCEKSYT